MDIQLDEVKNYLEGKGLTCIPIRNNDGSYIALDVFVKTIGNEVRLRCKFLNSFPYSFPKIYLLEEFYNKIKPIPHINDEGFICTFDSNVVIPNPNRPGELLYACIQKAQNIIIDGIQKSNSVDFLNEFRAYWDIESSKKSQCWILSIGEKSGLLFYYYDSFTMRYYVAIDKRQIVDFLLCCKNTIVPETSIKRCVYLEFSDNWYPPYPKTNREMYFKVKSDNKVYSTYNKYLKNRIDTSLVLFSQKIGDEKYYESWIHSPVSPPKKGLKIGKILTGYVYTCGKDSKNEVELMRTFEFDRNRIFFRGGDGKSFNIKPVVIGCGSVGSYLIQELSNMGVEKYTLIDSDVLNSENIARHMCGADCVGTYKVEAIKRALICHYPYIECDAFNMDAFNLIDDPSIIKNSNCIFVAVGSRPMELKVMEWIRNGIISLPVVILWVEPYAISGQALIINSMKECESLIFDSELKFKFSVIEDGNKYVKREAGCQSTFFPYSALELKKFLLNFLDYFANQFDMKETGIFLYTWAGRLSWARKQNIKLTGNWLAKSDQTIKIQRIL